MPKTEQSATAVSYFIASLQPSFLQKTREHDKRASREGVRQHEDCDWCLMVFQSAALSEDHTEKTGKILHGWYLLRGQEGFRDVVKSTVVMAKVSHSVWCKAEHKKTVVTLSSCQSIIFCLKGQDLKVKHRLEPYKSRSQMDWDISNGMWEYTVVSLTRNEKGEMTA